jgi:hypothetical protein
MTGWTIAIAAVLGGCSFPPLPSGPSDASDAAGDTADAADDASVPATSINLVVPAYVATGSTADWHATLTGPALVPFDYALAVAPQGAATVAPTAGSTTLGADGTLELDATLTAGASPQLATISVSVTGQTAGSGSAMVPVVELESLGFTGGGANEGDTAINAGRLVAMPLHIASGRQIVGFGFQARSTVNVQLALYGATGGAPGPLLAQSPVIHPQIGTVISYFAQPQMLASDAAFVAVVTESTTDLLEDLSGADAVTQYAANTTFGAALPSPFGTASTFSQGPYAIFVVAIAP